MSGRVLVLVGTRKGGFILEGDRARRSWALRGPFHPMWPIYHMNFDAGSGQLYAGGGNAWFGPTVWRSPDLGETWAQSSEGMTYGDDGPKISTVWHVTAAHGALWAGVDPAGLFRSDDGGETWQHVRGLRDHPTAEKWMPGAGGMCLHSIVPHPADPRQMWVAISAAGTFYTADGGATWTTLNRGVRAEFSPERYPEFGQCVHKLGIAPGRPERLYQQNHCGVYRSDDGGRSWQEISEGLPSDFGFPIGIHPRDPERIWTVPLHGMERSMPNGQLAVWRSSDSGSTWQRLTAGFPDRPAYCTVLREAMAVDRLDPAGVYFGTNTGQLFASHDEGDSWAQIGDLLPPITSVEVAVL